MQYEIARKLIVKRLVLFLALSILALNAANMVLNGYVRNYTGQGRLEINTKLVPDSLTGTMVNLYPINALQLKDVLRDCDITYTAETGCFLEGNISSSTARLVLTNAEYASFSGLDIVRGAFFSSDACHEGMKLAIISEKTAKELYSSYNIIGSDIVISGVKHRIAGIYRTRGTLLSYLGNDGMDRVYIPLESRDNYKKQAIGTIYIAGKSIREDEFRLHTVEAILQQKMNITTTDVNITDYYGSVLSMKGLQAFCIFCAGLYIMWIAISGVWATFKAIWAMLKKKGENFYLRDSIIACRFELIKASALMALELGMAYAAYVAVRFTPYLPSQIIPQDNIFDLGFYAGKIKDAIIMSNLSVAYLPSRLANAGNSSFWLETALLLIAVVMYALSISQLKLMWSIGCDLAEIINPLMISVAVSLLLTMAFAFAAGFGLTIAVKGIIIIIAAAVLYYARKLKVLNVFLFQGFI